MTHAMLRRLTSGRCTVIITFLLTYLLTHSLTSNPPLLNDDARFSVVADRNVRRAVGLDLRGDARSVRRGAVDADSASGRLRLQQRGQRVPVVQRHAHISTDVGRSPRYRHFT